MRMKLQQVEIMRDPEDAFVVTAVYMRPPESTFSVSKRWSKYADAVSSLRDVPETIEVTVSP